LSFQNFEKREIFLRRGASLDVGRDADSEILHSRVTGFMSAS
jgi:hypothetical protein